jgi:hypothetical protein
MWEAMAAHDPDIPGRNLVGGLTVAYCEPRKAKDNCPTFGAKDYAASLKAIAQHRLPGVLSETYSVASVPEVQEKWGDDPKALARAMKMRADFQAVLAKKSSFCSVVSNTPIVPIAHSEERIVVAPVVRPLSAKAALRKELHAACYQALKTYRVAPTEANLAAWEQAKKEYANA